MAKKAASTATSGVQVAPNFGFFRKLKTGDKYLDHNKKRPEYGFINSGSYAFNAALSGDVYQGFHMNKFFMAVGFFGTGKSLIAKLNFALELMKQGYYIFWYDTENETTEEMLIENFGFIPGQFEIVRMHTVEEFHHSMSLLVSQLEEDKGEKFENERKCAVVLDSAGGLFTNKGVDDAQKGADSADMTKAKKLKAFFTDMTFRCGELGVPMYITNHKYLKPTSYGNPEEIAGGEGAKYFARVIFDLTTGFEVVSATDKTKLGLILNVNIKKSCFVHVGTKVKMYLDWKTGLNPYYGLHDIAKAAGLLEAYTASKFPDVPPPAGRIGNAGAWVIKDPRKPRSEWIACLNKDLHKAETIGTILDPINDYVHETFKNKSLADKLGENGIDENVSLEVDEEAVERNLERARKESKKKAASMAKALGEEEEAPEPETAAMVVLDETAE